MGLEILKLILSIYLNQIYLYKIFELNITNVNNFHTVTGVKRVVWDATYDFHT